MPHHHRGLIAVIRGCYPSPCSSCRSLPKPLRQRSPPAARRRLKASLKPASPPRSPSATAFASTFSRSPPAGSPVSSPLPAPPAPTRLRRARHPALPVRHAAFNLDRLRLSRPGRGWLEPASFPICQLPSGLPAARGRLPGLPAIFPQRPRPASSAVGGSGSPRNRGHPHHPGRAPYPRHGRPVVCSRQCRRAFPYHRPHARAATGRHRQRTRTAALATLPAHLRTAARLSPSAGAQNPGTCL